jgi:hypothetical protein
VAAKAEILKSRLRETIKEKRNSGAVKIDFIK